MSERASRAAFDLASVRFEHRPLSSLAPRALFDLLRLRVDVFVVEQACPYPELDDHDVDPGTRHVLATLNGRLLGCARTIAPVSAADPARIGRVAVRDGYRGTGLAQALMRDTLDAIARAHPRHDVILGAQLRAERLYTAFGFERRSNEYVEDGLPHVDMILARGFRPSARAAGSSPRDTGSSA